MYSPARSSRLGTEFGMSAFGRGFAELLGNPVLRWMSRNSEMHQAAGSQFHNEKDKDGMESEINNRQEITGPNVVGMVMQERGPRLSGFSWWLHPLHVTLDGALRNLDPPFEELTAEALGPL